MTTVSVLGAGSWGTALALCAHRSGGKVTLWTHRPDHAQSLKDNGENTARLPGVPLPDDMVFTTDLALACAANIILVATPAQTVAPLSQKMAETGVADSYVIGCSKGIDIASGRLMSAVLKDAFPNQGIGILSGPSFALDVALGRPAAATIAASEMEIGRFLASSLSSQGFRLYPSDDLVGVSVGGALKNVIAIASGLASARGLGDSARAALITRGLAEMSRLGVALGGGSETFLGLSGVGDLLLSCTSMQSRNMAFGVMAGNHDRYEPLDQRNGPLAEGYFTAKAIRHLSLTEDVDLPICHAVYRFLYEGTSLTDEIAGLLARPLKLENAGI